MVQFTVERTNGIKNFIFKHRVVFFCVYLHMESMLMCINDLRFTSTSHTLLY